MIYRVMKSMSEIAQPSFLKLRDSTKSILFASNQEFEPHKIEVSIMQNMDLKSGIDK